MKPDNRSIEEIDMIEEKDTLEEYEMIPLDPRMYGYEQRNMTKDYDFTPGIEKTIGYMNNANLGMEMYPSMGMYPNINRCPYMGINQNMEMNRDMQVNPSIETSLNFGAPSNMDTDIEEFKDEYNDLNRIDETCNDVDSIVRKMERYNPSVFRLLNRCRMPYTEANDVVRRIVRLTLMYSEE